MNVLAFDIGGTKVLGGIVSAQGKVLKSQKFYVQKEKGCQFFIDSLVDLGKNLLVGYPGIKSIGIGSAGPLDSEKKELTDPTNFLTRGKHWGRVPLGAYLEKHLGKKVFLENDADTALLGETSPWAKRKTYYKNEMILTLGTGVGVAVIANGKLLKSGRNYHPEASHMIIGPGDKSAPCGCGNHGCLEAYLSGTAMAFRARNLFGLNIKTSEELYNLARNRDKKALLFFEDYSRKLAIGIHNYVVMFYPERIIFAGSASRCFRFFKKNTEMELQLLLKRRLKTLPLMPKLENSKLGDFSGLLGAARTCHLITNQV